VIYLDHNATTPVFSLGVETTAAEVGDAIAAVQRCGATLEGTR